MVFYVSLWFVSYKTPKCGIFSRFWEILSKNGPILPKMGPGTLKCENWDFTFVETSFDKECPMELKFGPDTHHVVAKKRK